MAGEAVSASSDIAAEFGASIARAAARCETCTSSRSIVCGLCTKAYGDERENDATGQALPKTSINISL
ncbi:hypothetical protein PC110_g4340 [Phytophthora cactorum]|uniref:Uncharacterized protein n=1 Tax=Phytophthora cactorum TaxID=29920 RepID=A0A329SUK2_9STRA|nr:hypothetical protein PC120_g13347 [Phytophthora cactorum]KAG3063003.1 hypothetical protein PC122_g19041 [Phytophthora cactorum]KAG3161853.1 hypothetical protein PC128_g20716 [Phytophthora cactorum]RAW39448.1 hypothetical protein PC110_g4340 [Phytophthora cactorum]